jgi:hypothetical protein
MQARRPMRVVLSAKKRGAYPQSNVVFDPNGNLSVQRDLPGWRLWHWVGDNTVAPTANSYLAHGTH